MLMGRGFLSKSWLVPMQTELEDRVHTKTLSAKSDSLALKSKVFLGASLEHQGSPDAKSPHRMQVTDPWGQVPVPEAGCFKLIG